MFWLNVEFAAMSLNLSQFSKAAYSEVQLYTAVLPFEAPLLRHGGIGCRSESHGKLREDLHHQCLGNPK